MVTLTHNITANINVHESANQEKYLFVTKNRELMNVNNSINFDMQEFNNLMAEGYIVLAEEHSKFAEDSIFLASESSSNIEQCR
jgi:hypothetical protein